MRHILYILSALMMMAVCSCSKDTATYPPCSIDRVDKLFPGYSTLPPDEKAATLDSLRVPIDVMFRVMGTDTVTEETLDRWCAGEVVRVFQPDVDRVYSNVDTLSHQIGAIMARARVEGLDLPDMRFATVTWGNRRSLVRVDTVMLIALNHYLGADYPGYAQWPQFSRADKTPQRLPYDIAAALAATQYPAEMAAHPTMLSWMLYEGALVEARMRLVPDADLAEALGYTPDQLACVQAGLKTIWGEMAARRLIYSTDALTIERYLDPAPSTPLLGGKAPGRVGRYVGYEIVKAYLKRNPKTALPQLLAPTLYGDEGTLVESGFNP